MHFLLKICYAILNGLIFVLGLLVGKNRNYILIGGWMGKDYADNSKALFEYLNEHNPGYKKIVFFTRSQAVYQEIRKKGFFVVKGHSPQAIFYHLKCKIHVIDNDFYSDILSILSCGSVRVYLCHGSGFKTVGNRFVPGSFPPDNFWNKISSRGCWRDCFYIASSLFERQQIIDYYAPDPKKIVLSSHPRLLYLQSTKKSEESKVFNVFYLPTFRNKRTPNPVFGNIENFNSFLAKNGIEFYYKPHRAEKNIGLQGKYSNVHLVSASTDIYTFPVGMDLIISDYSSALYDFLLLGKNVLNFPFDLDSFQAEERNMYLPYEETCPMGIAYTYQELLSQMMFIKNNQLLYKQQNSIKTDAIICQLYGGKSPDITKLLDLVSPSRKWAKR